MRKAAFQRPDFLAAARSLVSEQGPATVTVDSVMQKLNAPKGSFYYLSRFAHHAFGRTTSTELQCAAFVLVEAPGAAVKEHIRRRKSPPALVDEMIRKTYHAIVPKRAAPADRHGGREKH
jgi:hypothetical protein